MAGTCMSLQHIFSPASICKTLIKLPSLRVNIAKCEYMLASVSMCLYANEMNAFDSDTQNYTQCSSFKCGNCSYVSSGGFFPSPHTGGHMTLQITKRNLGSNCDNTSNNNNKQPRKKTCKLNETQIVNATVIAIMVASVYCSCCAHLTTIQLKKLIHFKIYNNIIDRIK